MQFSRGPVIGALATCLALSATVTGSAVAGPSAPSKASPEAKAQTPYGLSAGAYGSRATGGDLPADSGRTAFTFIGCTKTAGLNKTNSLAGLVDLADVDVRGVRTRVWTTRANTDNGVAVSSHALTRVASVDIGDGGALQGLEISGLRLKTRAFHDNRGFRTERDLSFAEISLNGVALPNLLDPKPGAQLTVPGVGRVTFLASTQSRNANGARVFARGLQVKLSDTNTTVTVASASSQINNQVPAGILGGYGRAANVRLLDGTVVSGKIAVQPLPCQGTDGKWRTNDTVGLNLPGVLRIGAASGSARGDQVNAGNAYGQTRGRIARAAFGDRLVIGAIVAQAKVTKDGGRLTKSAAGTSVGFIRVNGKDRNVPDAGGTLTIRGLAEITVQKVVRSATGIRVIAVQVKLLDGSIKNTVNLGEAFARIKRS